MVCHGRAWGLRWPAFSERRGAHWRNKRRCHRAPYRTPPSEASFSQSPASSSASSLGDAVIVARA
eukprot:6714339-Lingulodinium_polyedra.AAC.1